MRRTSGGRVTAGNAGPHQTTPHRHATGHATNSSPARLAMSFFTPPLRERDRDLLVVAGQLRGHDGPFPERAVAHAVAVAVAPLPGHDGARRHRAGGALALAGLEAARRVVGEPDVGTCRSGRRSTPHASRPGRARDGTSRPSVAHPAAPRTRRPAAAGAVRGVPSPTGVAPRAGRHRRLGRTADRS